MADAVNAANDLMVRYFGSRGRPTPRAHCRSILSELRVSRVDHQWHNPSMINRADAALHEARWDVDDLAENFLGVELSVESLERFDAAAGAPVYGLARPLNREIVLCERTLEYEPLYRATVMHEVAHIILHADGRRQDAHYAPGSSKRPGFEREADSFMVATLLPDDVILLGVSLWAQTFGISLHEALGSANTARGRWQWRNRLFAPLINTLCLSRELISIKMKTLGCFTAETVDFHRTYHLDNQWLNRKAVTPFRRAVESVLETAQAARSRSA